MLDCAFISSNLERFDWINMHDLKSNIIKSPSEVLNKWKPFSASFCKIRTVKLDILKLIVWKTINIPYKFQFIFVILRSYLNVSFIYFSLCLDISFSKTSLVQSRTYGILQNVVLHEFILKSVQNVIQIFLMLGPQFFILI